MLLFSREDISSSLGIDVTEVDEYIKLRLVMGRLPLKTTTFSVATVVTILEDQVYGRAAKSIDQMDTIEKFLDKWNTNILHLEYQNTHLFITFLILFITNSFVCYKLIITFATELKINEL